MKSEVEVTKLHHSSHLQQVEVIQLDKEKGVTVLALCMMFLIEISTKMLIGP